MIPLHRELREQTLKCVAVKLTTKNNNKNDKTTFPL